MPLVTCPTCGERGKIAATLIGVRVKCRKCGEGFLAGPPADKPVDSPADKPVDSAAGKPVDSAAGRPLAAAAPAAVVEAHGIEVEGLDGSAWVLPTAADGGVPIVAVAETTQIDGALAAARPSAGAREYKLLTSRDRYFDNKFDLARLEEALNHYARQGWVARSMSTPHVKGFTGVVEEVIVVLLERGPAAG